MGCLQKLRSLTQLFAQEFDQRRIPNGVHRIELVIEIGDVGTPSVKLTVSD
jgi:hypothetical protein